VENRVSF